MTFRKIFTKTNLTCEICNTKNVISINEDDTDFECMNCSWYYINNTSAVGKEEEEI